MEQCAAGRGDRGHGCCFSIHLVACLLNEFLSKKVGWEDAR